MIINMTSGGVVPERILDAQTITPTTENQVIEEETYLRGALTILGDSDLLPENIVKGKNIFGIDGSYDSATADPDLLPENIREGVDIFGVLGAMKDTIGIDYGVVTYSSMGTTANFSHNLGVVPSNVFLVPITLSVTGTARREYAFFNTTYLSINGSGSSVSADIGSGPGIITKTATSVQFNLFYGLAPGTYYWFAIA